MLLETENFLACVKYSKVPSEDRFYTGNFVDVGTTALWGEIVRFAVKEQSLGRSMAGTGK